MVVAVVVAAVAVVVAAVAKAVAVAEAAVTAFPFFILIPTDEKQNNGATRK